MPDSKPKVSEAWERTVEGVRGRLRSVERELNGVLRTLYGNNLARMSGGRRGRLLPKPVFKKVAASRARLERQRESLRGELRHLGAE